MSRIAKLAENIANHKFFKGLVLILIVLSAVLIGLETYPMISVRFYDALILIEKLIIVFFSLEIIIKLLAYEKKPWKFFTDPWNTFDFIVIAVCLIPNVDTHFFALLRILRILRVLRMITFFPKLRLLVGALLKSIPSMGYVILLIFILFYIYAVLGIFLYGQKDPTHFGDLHHAMVTLFKVLTLEGWTDILNEHMYGGGSESSQKIISLFPFIYFASFIVIGAMIIMNLFIGVIMKSMDESQEEMNKELQSKNLKVKSQAEIYLHIISQLDSLRQEIKDLKDSTEKSK